MLFDRILAIIALLIALAVLALKVGGHFGWF